MGNALLDKLKEGPLLLDGGVGTLLQNAGLPAEGSLELLNLTDPARVQSVYKQFIEAGSQVILTNTYGASAWALESYGAADRVREINRRSVRLAREVRELMGVHVLVGGSIGPLGEYLETTGLGNVSVDLARSMYRKQADALVEGGADLIVIETFADLGEALVALEAVRSVSDLPVVASMTFDDDARSALGQTAAQAAVALLGAGAAVVGANCSSGPRAVLRAVREMAAAAPDALLWAKPNAGLPVRQQGRFFYPSGPDYAATFAAEAAAAGARLVGGCCGMGPEHLAAMGTALRRFEPVREVSVTVPEKPAVRRPATPKPSVGAKPSVLGAKIANQEFILSIEMHPPRTHLTGAFLRAAREYREAGIDLVNVVDSPMARVRMSSLMACALLQERVGLETITHLTPRDRTLIGLQSELIGAHALGVRNILCVTGDPHPPGHTAPGSVNVYDVDAIGMMRMLAGYNSGVDLKGNDIGQPAHFLIGGALNPNAPDLGLEIERFHQKLETGMEFCMVQPVFDAEVLARLLERLGNPPIPVIAGIVPIHSFQHAMLLHNEIPGIRLTETVLERMRRAEADAEREGLSIARELLAACRERFQGVYIMPSYGRHETALKVVQG